MAFVHRLSVAWLALAVGCHGDDGGTTASSLSATQGTTTATTTMGASTESTSDATATATDATGVTATSAGCSEGAELCAMGAHQVCEGGAWKDAPCGADQYCDAGAGTCAMCACAPGSTGACVDEGSLDTCKGDCSGFEAKPCGADALCKDGACVDVVCVPGEPSCVDDGSFHVCGDDGTGYGAMVPCNAGSKCAGGACLTPCEVAATVKSNVGCEFWAVDMANVPPRDAYVYAVAISNPSATETVTVEVFDRNDKGKEQKIVTQSIGPRKVEVINLSGSNQGKMGFYSGDAGFLGSGIALGRAFRLRSDLPVVATQFNPIGGASGFTTDASLLLPTHTLGTEYLHMAWHRGFGAGSALLVVATADATKVTVTPTIDVPAGMNGLPAMKAGQPTEVTLGRYDYVQISGGASGNDLSGSEITSSAPVAVFGGHSCGSVPTTAVNGCDHLEEQIVPLEAWGKSYVAARTPPRADEPMLWRILASEDNTKIDFDPPTSLGPTLTVDRGDVVELQEPGDFTISAAAPVLVAGYMLGCQATGLKECPGDPSMVLMVPVEQYQSDYVFLVDSSYAKDSATLVREAGAEVTVGCLGVVPADHWSKIGATGWERAVVDMNPGEAMCKPGTNEASGAKPFGVIVSGEAAATSYAYPGGLALLPINPQ